MQKILLEPSYGSWEAIQSIQIEWEQIRSMAMCSPKEVIGILQIWQRVYIYYYNKKIAEKFVIYIPSF